MLLKSMTNKYSNLQRLIAIIFFHMGATAQISRSCEFDEREFISIINAPHFFISALNFLTCIHLSWILIHQSC